MLMIILLKNFLMAMPVGSRFSLHPSKRLSVLASSFVCFGASWLAYCCTCSRHQMAHSTIRQAPRALVRSWGLTGPISYGLGRVAFRHHVTPTRQGRCRDVASCEFRRGGAAPQRPRQLYVTSTRTAM